jgi:hypothetical protein
MAQYVRKQISCRLRCPESEVSRAITSFHFNDRGNEFFRRVDSEKRPCLSALPVLSGINRETVGLETSKPRFDNSLCVRRAPNNGFAETMVRTNFRSGPKFASAGLPWPRELTPIPLKRLRRHAICGQHWDCASAAFQPCGSQHILCENCRFGQSAGWSFLLSAIQQQPCCGAAHSPAYLIKVSARQNGISVNNTRSGFSKTDGPRP